MEFFSLFLDLTHLCFLLPQLRCRQNKKTLESVQWVMVRRLASVANSTASLVVKFVQLKMKPTRRNQRLFSGTKRKMPHQGQLAEDSLFLDGPSVGELQTMPKRKDPKCSR